MRCANNGTKLCKINKIFRVPLFPRGSIGTKNIWNVQLKKQRASSILQQNYQLGSDPKLPIFVNIETRDLFEEEWKAERKREMFESLRLLLTNLLTSTCKRITNDIVYRYILQHEFLPRHAKIILSDMQKKGQLECYKMDTGQPAPKGSFYLNYRYYTKPCAVFVYK